MAKKVKSFKVYLEPEEGDVYFTTIILYRYQFFETLATLNCKDKERCGIENYHKCACFKKFVDQMNQLTINFQREEAEKEKKKDDEGTSE